MNVENTWICLFDAWEKNMNIFPKWWFNVDNDLFFQIQVSHPLIEPVAATFRENNSLTSFCFACWNLLRESTWLKSVTDDSSGISEASTVPKSHGSIKSSTSHSYLRSFNIIIQANVYQKQNLTSPLYSNTISKKFASFPQSSASPKKNKSLRVLSSLQGQRFHSLDYPKSSSHSWLEHPHVHRKYIFNQDPFSSQLCELIPECMTA